MNEKGRKKIQKYKKVKKIKNKKTKENIYERSITKNEKERMKNEGKQIT